MALKVSHFLNLASAKATSTRGDTSWSFPELGVPVSKIRLYFQAMLDRGLRVLLPNQARREANLPPDFFNLTAEELKREQQARFKLLFLFSTLFFD
jgi:hypothetical protein